MLKESRTGDMEVVGVCIAYGLSGTIASVYSGRKGMDTQNLVLYNEWPTCSF